MTKSSEIIDDTFGSVSLVEESAYFAEVPWNRGSTIRLFIHIEGDNHRQYIENAKHVFSSVRQHEVELFRQGIKQLASTGRIQDPEDCDYEELFLNNVAETSIEINSIGGGHLVYLVMMAGSLIIEFSEDGTFRDAQAMEG